MTTIDETLRAYEPALRRLARGWSRRSYHADLLAVGRIQLWRNVTDGHAPLYRVRFAMHDEVRRQTHVLRSNVDPAWTRSSPVFVPLDAAAKEGRLPATWHPYAIDHDAPECVLPVVDRSPRARRFGTLRVPEARRGAYEAALARLDPRDAAVVRDREAGLSYAQIATRLAVSQPRVVQLYGRALPTVMAALEGAA